MLAFDFEMSSFTAMGGALLSTPWRNLPRNKEEDLDFVKLYKPGNKNLKHLRILLYGPIGAGKSSFINSIDTILQSRITGRAPTDAISGRSYTTKYKTYKIKKGPESVYPFVFNDIMGFEQNTDTGVLVEDVKLALQGHVEEGYQFKPKDQLEEGDEGYRSSPTLDDRVHVLVCVIPADKVSLIDDKVVKKMREVRLAANELNIPQLAILTKVDSDCPEAKKNLNNVYRSKYLKNQVDKFYTLMGIPQNCIFLVKNYEPEPNINDDMNALIMNALRQMITFGEDFLSDP
ncbi:interferon-induced protein 44-like isoform X1 [Epinephelus lanceolatus]